MNKSDIYEYLKNEFPHLNKEDLKKVLDGTFEAMIEELKSGNRIEIRGLGSFKIKTRETRIAKNPKTGEWVEVPEKKTVYFKVGKVLKKKLASRNG